MPIFGSATSSQNQPTEASGYVRATSLVASERSVTLQEDSRTVTVPEDSRTVTAEP